MTFLLALLGGIAGAGAGFFLGLGIGSLLASFLGISSFEGASGYFAVGIGLIGGAIGLIAGIVSVLRYKGGHRRPGAILGRVALVLGGLAALVFVGIQIRLATLENFPDGQNPQLHFEIRLPAGTAEPRRQGLDFEMQAGSQRSGGLLKDEWLRRDGERFVLSGFVPLYTRTSQRFLVMSRPGEPKLVFRIRLSAMPAVSEQFGPWQRVDIVDDGTTRPATDRDDYAIRYMVTH